MTPTIVFLDVDGVLNATLSPSDEGVVVLRSTMWIETALVERLKRILAVLDPCKLVLSSTWRLWRFALDQDGPSAVRFLSQHIGRRFDGETPVSMRGHRGTEIAAWRIANAPDARAVIIDDSRDAFEEPGPREGDLLLDCGGAGGFGLTEEHVAQAIAWVKTGGGDGR